MLIVNSCSAEHHIAKVLPGGGGGGGGPFAPLEGGGGGGGGGGALVGFGGPPPGGGGGGGGGAFGDTGADFESVPTAMALLSERGCFGEEGAFLVGERFRPLGEESPSSSLAGLF